MSLGIAASNGAGPIMRAQAKGYSFPSQPTITFPVEFTPDGKNVAYRVIDKGTDNIWIQPVDGSKGHPVTEFATDHIRYFSWSPDGKTLAVVRGHLISDVVLLREGKAAQ